MGNTLSRKPSHGEARGKAKGAARQLGGGFLRNLDFSKNQLMIHRALGIAPRPETVN